MEVVVVDRAANNQSLQIGCEKSLRACVILLCQGRALSGERERRNCRSEKWQAQTHFHGR
jgi:hypothetical protein